MRHAREDLGIKFWVEEHGLPKIYQKGYRCKGSDEEEDEDDAVLDQASDVEEDVDLDLD